MMMNTHFKTANLLLVCAIMIVGVRAFGVQRTADKCKCCYIRIKFVILHIISRTSFVLT